MDTTARWRAVVGAPVPGDTRCQWKADRDAPDRAQGHRTGTTTRWTNVTVERPDPADSRHLQAFVLEAGRALCLAGTAVSETQERLTRIAAANGARDARVIAFPTALMIALDGEGPTTIDVVPQLTGALRLDQISVLYEVVKQAERGELEPAHGLARLRAIRVMTPRHGRLVTLAAHIAMTIGLCLILRPTPLDVVLAAGLGALIGVFALLARGHHTVSVLIPVFSATVVSALTFTALKHGFADAGLRTLVAPLVTFLPGGALTTATVELASGEMLAGASRLVSGALQMLLLAFAIIVGVRLAGLPNAEVLHDNPANLLGWWAPWLGVVVFGLAASVYFSAPRGALPWLMVVLLTAWIGQLTGDWLAGANASGFFGAIAMTPVAMAISHLPGGPPSQVTFLPAFWLLVPGAVGLIGVAEAFGSPADAGLQDLVQPLASILAIALGVLCGASIHRGLTTPARLLRLKRTSRTPPDENP
jgi:uncharacterized membrane protein YjjP (DUF1212 family)